METAIALAFMLNAFMHDFSTAIFGTSAIAAWVLVRKEPDPAAREALRPVVQAMVKVGAWAFGGIIILGIFRAIGYEKYEWMGVAGPAQIAVLGVKHVVLVGFTIIGILALRRARKIYGRAADSAAPS